MIPTLAVPNMQVAPPVDTSAFTAPSPEPALGRLPLSIVPATVSNPKVSDNPRGGQQANLRDNGNAATQLKPKQAFSLASAQGEIAFESPYSTPFVAQLFGQFAMTDGFLDFDQLADMNLIKYRPSLAFRPRDAAPAVAAEPSRPEAQAPAEAPVQATATPDAESDSMRMMMRSVLGSDISFTLAQSAAETTQDAAPATAEPEASADTVDSSQISPSLFTQGPEAYGATQSRNSLEGSAEARRPEISLVM